MFKVGVGLEKKIEGYKKLIRAIKDYAPKNGEGSLAPQFSKCIDTLHNFVSKVER